MTNPISRDTAADIVYLYAQHDATKRTASDLQGRVGSAEVTIPVDGVYRNLIVSYDTLREIAAARLVDLADEIEQLGGERPS